MRNSSKICRSAENKSRQTLFGNPNFWVQITGRTQFARHNPTHSQLWLVPSRPPASPPEARPPASSSPPRRLASPPPPPVASRSPTATGPVPSLSARSASTRSPPSSSSASSPSSASSARSPRTSRPTSLPVLRRPRPSGGVRGLPRPRQALFEDTNLCAIHAKRVNTHHHAQGHPARTPAASVASAFEFPDLPALVATPRLCSEATSSTTLRCDRPSGLAQTLGLAASLSRRSPIGVDTAPDSSAAANAPHALGLSAPSASGHSGSSHRCFPKCGW